METDAASLVGSHSGPDEICLQIIEDKPEESLDTDECYLMNRACRGKAIIFNEDELFEGDVDRRMNAAKDLETLVATFKILGLRDDDIHVKNNLKFRVIEECLKELSEADYTDVDCLIVAFLSQWERNNDGDQKLWDSFSPENCETLAEKPKIFFMQACRSRDRPVVTTMVSSRACFGLCGYVVCGVVIGGAVFRMVTGSILGAVGCGVLGNYLNGVTFSIIGTIIGFVMGGIGGGLCGDEGFIKGASEDPPDINPTAADFLIARSSPKDMVLPWSPEKGTWFIQSLCEELQASASSVDLLEAITLTASRLVCNHVSHDDVDRVKSVPSVTSTLTKKIFFPVAEP